MSTLKTCLGTRRFVKMIPQPLRLMEFSSVMDLFCHLFCLMWWPCLHVAVKFLKYGCAPEELAISPKLRPIDTVT